MNSETFVPNQTPREKSVEDEVTTYVYQDFANVQPDALGNSSLYHDSAPPSSLISQKLPGKLSSMLADPGM